MTIKKGVWQRGLLPCMLFLRLASQSHIRKGMDWWSAYHRFVPLPEFANQSTVVLIVLYFDCSVL